MILTREVSAKGTCPLCGGVEAVVVTGSQVYHTVVQGADVTPATDVTISDVIVVTSYTLVILSVRYL